MKKEFLRIFKGRAVRVWTGPRFWKFCDPCPDWTVQCGHKFLNFFQSWSDPRNRLVLDQSVLVHGSLTSVKIFTEILVFRIFWDSSLKWANLNCTSLLLLKQTSSLQLPKNLFRVDWIYSETCSCRTCSDLTNLTRTDPRFVIVRDRSWSFVSKTVNNKLKSFA